MKARRLLMGALVAMLLLMGLATPAQAATPAEIEQAIDDGLAWLASQQEADGSWPEYWEDVATTGLAVLKFEHRAYELGYSSPFDPAYPYHQNVEDGLNYLFRKANLLITPISEQDHTGGASGNIDDPDTNGNGNGVYAHGHVYPFDVYDTGIVLSAISASGTPTRVVNLPDPPGSWVSGWQYIDVAQDMVDWLAWAQSDFDYAPNGMGEGGWSYGALDNDDQMGSYGPDNSNGGYAVLGLAYAEDFGCTVPQWVRTELNAYVEDIQDPVDGDQTDGGSWYDHPGDGIGVNILKTGNLIFEMAFVGDTLATPRVVDALDYLARHWGDASGANQPPGWDGNPAQYQTMFTTMKGLEYMGVNVFDGIDWYADFSDRIVAQQTAIGPDAGSWQTSSGRGNPTIITEWALLTLERVSPLPALSLHPAFDTNPVDTAHTVTAIYKRGGVPQAGVPIDFAVIAGPNMNNGGRGITDANGEATFTYTGDGGTGKDTIRATVELDAGAAPISAQATKVWERGVPPPVPGMTGWGIIAALILLAGLMLVVRRRRLAGGR